MKRTDLITFAIISAFMLMASAFDTHAQEIPAAQEYEYVDSLVYVLRPAVDSTFVGKDIFRDMPSEYAGDDATVTVNQDRIIETSMRSHIAANSSRTMSGYRVRIYFDNNQNSRADSERTKDKFTKLFRDIPAYRTYTNPYFKVTVGDCRTKSEAMLLLNRIKGAFPSAFVVKENISYPAVDRNDVFYVDTVKVLRPVTDR